MWFITAQYMDKHEEIVIKLKFSFSKEQMLVMSLVFIRLSHLIDSLTVTFGLNV